MKSYRIIYEVSRTIGGVSKVERASMVIKAETLKSAEKYFNKKYVKVLSVKLVA